MFVVKNSIQAPLHEEMSTVQRGKRQDSIDALSFGTVLSSDASDDENGSQKFHNKRPPHDDNMQVVTIFHLLHCKNYTAFYAPPQGSLPFPSCKYIP